MTTEKIQALFDALDELLEQERTALVEGNLEQVSRLVARKEDLIDQLGALERAELADIEILNGKIKRNQDLLDQALEAIRAVAQRMSAMRRVHSSLDTYDSRGAKSSIETGEKGSVEKRA